ncbi:MAG: toll/interleukin-1 receptor domain-containing protein [Campylobacteraceae bacterium]|nr:toll/interleukin-1 receptor domain-containing protein [Campylobacteraceae bacterium]
MSKELKIFVSYAHEDSEYKDELLKQCSLFNEVELWTDDSIRAGDIFDTKISEEIESCDMAILLISSTYWTKEYIQDKELPLLLDNEEKRNISIIPILLNGFNKIKRTKLKDRTLIPLFKNILQALDDFDVPRKGWDIIYY